MLRPYGRIVDRVELVETVVVDVLQVGAAWKTVYVPELTLFSSLIMYT